MDNLLWITEKNAVFLKKKKKSNKMWITKTNLYTSKIAREKNLPIGLYAEPQDETINEADLKNFYYSCGFEFDADDCDGKLFIWK